ncbi:MAG: HigA family addiction module antidote protein [Proteobacteria bacterium]|nr:HigA family addiction module antidote protein [Pseudomonadota bacterium]
MIDILEMKRAPTHPGAILREDVLPALGLSKAEVARRLRISRPTLYDILDEKAAISPLMALRLGRFCGNGPEIWIRMQAAHDLWHASRSKAAEKIATIEPATAHA